MSDRAYVTVPCPRCGALWIAVVYQDEPNGIEFSDRNEICDCQLTRTDLAACVGLAHRLRLQEEATDER